MALTADDKRQLLLILSLMSQGQKGRGSLAALQLVLAMMEKRKAEEILIVRLIEAAEMEAMHDSAE